jgi:glycosyltransferase involved in cell wall biosynthesis
MELSILVPAVFERRSWELYDHLLKMIGDKPVELLVLFDNKRRSLGAKRNALLAAARGRFIAHLDDDDFFVREYLDSVLPAIAANPDADLICYDQHASLNREPVFRVNTDINNPNEQARRDEHGNWATIRRKPWVWCCWRRELVQAVTFPDKTNAEDWLWIEQVLPLVKKQVKIDRVLHVYIYDDTKSVAKGLP